MGAGLDREVFGGIEGGGFERRAFGDGDGKQGRGNVLRPDGVSEISGCVGWRSERRGGKTSGGDLVGQKAGLMACLSLLN